MSDGDVGTATDSPDPLVAIAAAITDLQTRMTSLERAPWNDAIGVGGVLVAGDIILGGGTSRAGFLLCDGTAVSRSTYAALFAAVGTSFGTGDGSTTFNVPDFRGQAPIGAGTGPGLTARTLGTSVGTETTTLTGPQSGIAQHNHTIAAATGSTTPGNTGGPSTANTGAGSAHSHSSTTVTTGATAVPTAAPTANVASSGSGAINVGTPTIGNESAHTHSLSAHTHTSAAHTHPLPDTDNAGPTNAAQAHSNMQPSLPVNFFIKT